MPTNPIIESMLKRRSVRTYSDRKPTDEEITTVVRAGQQAPFASQLCSVLLSRAKAPFGAPLWFTFCVDVHRMELIMAKRGWAMVTNDLSLLLFGIQDAALMAENMVIAAESLGMGSCFLGGTPYRAKHIRKQYNLPPRVFPLVELVMGYPAEEFPPRPRYPMEFTLFEDRYPELTDEMVEDAMRVMDEGYLTHLRHFGFESSFLTTSYGVPDGAWHNISSTLTSPRPIPRLSSFPSLPCQPYRRWHRHPHCLQRLPAPSLGGPPYHESLPVPRLDL